MRAFSFIPVVALAATSLSAASPAVEISNRAISTRDDGSVQDMINIITAANSQLKTLGSQLSTATSAESLDVNQVDSIITQINTVVSDASGKLKTASQGVEMTQANLSALSPVVFTLINLLNSILFNLIPSLKAILAATGVNTVALVNNLLSSVSILANFLQPFTVGTLIGILQPVISLLDFVLNTVAKILGLNY